MKKFICVILAAAIAMFAAGCSEEKAAEKETKAKKETTEISAEAVETQSTTQAATEDDMVITPESKKEFTFEVVECVFDNSITAVDEEYVYNSYAEKENSVYVDLVLRVANTGNTPLTGNDFSGYLIYNDTRYDMQTAIENVTGISVGVSEVKAKDVAKVHLFERLDKEAENSDITVTYTVSGKTYEEKVKPATNSSNSLDKKTEIKVGDVINVDSRYSFEVIEASAVESVHAQDINASKQYKPIGKDKFAHVLIKLKNNSELPLSNSNALVYTITDDVISKGTFAKETSNNTDINSYVSLNGGEEEFVHLYVGVNDTDIAAGNVILRFNLGGNCYYCKIK